MKHECDDSATCPVCRRAVGKDPQLGTDTWRVESDNDATVVFEFEASKQGHCRLCGRGTYPGEWIAKLSNDAYVHADCA